MSRATIEAARAARNRLASQRLPSITLDGGGVLVPDVRVPGRGWRGNRYFVLLPGPGLIGWVSRRSGQTQWGWSASGVADCKLGFESAEDAALDIVRAHRRRAPADDRPRVPGRTA